MVGKRGPGSRRPGPPKRVSKKAQTAKAKSAAASTQQAIRLSRRSSDGAVKVATGRMKSTDKAGSENLSTIVNKALVELNEHLLENPHKILVLLRMAKKESYFKKAF